MLEQIFGDVGSLMEPTIQTGIWVWNIMMAMIGVTAIQTPAVFSAEAWNFVVTDVYSFTSAIGASLLNTFFFVGFLRKSGNLKEDMTTETLVEVGIKVSLANWVIVAGPILTQLMFGIASETSLLFIYENNIFIEAAEGDLGSVIFYIFLGIVFTAVCFVCSAQMFLVVYGRYLQLYMLVGTMPLAISALPGGGGVSQTTYAWVRTFLAKCFEIVIIVLAIVIAAEMYNALEFGGLLEITGVFESTVQMLNNMLLMLLLTASVKGAEAFMKKTFNL